MASTQLQGMNIMVYAQIDNALKAIGGQKNCTLSMEADTIDVSNKNDFGWSSFIAGARSWTVSCDGQFLVTESEVTVEGSDEKETVYTQDSDQSALMDIFLNSKVVKIEMKDAQGGICYSGDAVITSLELEAAFDDVFAYSVEFQGKGPLSAEPKTKPGQN